MHLPSRATSVAGACSSVTCRSTRQSAVARPAVCLGREERHSPPSWINFRGIPRVSGRCTAGASENRRDRQPRFRFKGAAILGQTHARCEVARRGPIYILTAPKQAAQASANRTLGERVFRQKSRPTPLSRCRIRSPGFGNAIDMGIGGTRARIDCSKRRHEYNNKARKVFQLAWYLILSWTTSSLSLSTRTASTARTKRQIHPEDHPINRSMAPVWSAGTQ